VIVRSQLRQPFWRRHLVACESRTSPPSVCDPRGVTAEFPPELTDPPETPPAWWRWPVTVGVLMGLNILNFALTTGHRRGAAWVLAVSVLVGSVGIARELWKHRRSTDGTR
jgi:hypothetical protein